jgi:oligoribonuclease NrnB/cAMP/cGMP phosphodiesterase (DHH superfamily)
LQRLENDVQDDRSLVIYHGDCFDGFTSAWAFRTLHPGVAATYVAAKHGDRPPELAGQDVYILDFAYPRETLLQLYDQARSLLVLDHHKTAEADLAGLPFCEFDMERSGAGITWDHFARAGMERHWLVNIVEDRDLWRFRYGDKTRHTMAYVATLPMTFEAWDELANSGMDQVLDKGAAIQRYIESYGETAVQHAVLRKVGGHVIPIINLTPQNSSEHIDRLIDRYPDHPFAASFFLRGDGRWQFSLRSRGSFDVSEVARQYGGGGHRNASGFVVDVLPWEQE